MDPYFHKELQVIADRTGEGTRRRRERDIVRDNIFTDID